MLFPEVYCTIVVVQYNGLWSVTWTWEFMDNKITYPLSNDSGLDFDARRLEADIFLIILFFICLSSALSATLVTATPYFCLAHKSDKWSTTALSCSVFNTCFFHHDRETAVIPFYCYYGNWVWSCWEITACICVQFYSENVISFLLSCLCSEGFRTCLSQLAQSINNSVLILWNFHCRGAICFITVVTCCQLLFVVKTEVAWSCFNV